MEKEVKLTERVKHQPYSVILLDEFEKAHSDIYNLLLPVLDEGWLTDAEGSKVSFRNCIIIGTANIGSEILIEGTKKVGISTTPQEDDGDQHDEVMKEVRKFLRPEFMNRMDEIVIFNKLEKKQLKLILDIYINDLEKRLKDLGFKLDFNEKVKDFIINGLDSLNYGARPLKRKMETLIENNVASLLMDHKSSSGKTLAVLLEKDKINLKFKKIELRFHLEKSF